MNSTAADESPFPLNRVVAFAGPYISLVSGALAAWLLVHVHVLGLFHLRPDGLSAPIAQGAVFLLGTAVTWAGHHKWLTGHQIALAQAVNAAADPALPAEVPPAGDEVHFEPADIARAQTPVTDPERPGAEGAPAEPDLPPGGTPPAEEPLPTDEEEAASPPDPVDPESRVTPDAPEVPA